MRKLVQKVVELDTLYSSDKTLLQSKLDELSKDGWELCGQVGIFHVVKRYEEETKVYQGGYFQPNQPNNPFNNQQPPYYGYNGGNGSGYGYGYNNYGYNYNYNNSYNPGYRPNFSPNPPFGYQNYNQPQPQQPPYNPSIFGTPVYNQGNKYNNSKEDEDED